jgi:hypothetical protein
MSGEDIIHELCDVVTIKKASAGALKVKLNTVGRNFSECSFEETMAPSGPNEWRWSSTAPDSACAVTLTQTESEIDLSSTDDCYDEFCGVGAYLGSTFPMSSRKPVGTFEWPQR